MTDLSKRSSEAVGARKPPAVIFIAGLGHSGSTLLDLLLGANDRVVGLGEVYNYLCRRPAEREIRRQPPCTCGRDLRDCEFWGVIKDECENPERTVEEKYRVVLARFREVFGPGMAMVDSSKKVTPLRHLAEIDEDIVVIHLVRDVRSWTISMIDRGARWASLEQPDLVRAHGARAASRRARMTPWYHRTELGRPIRFLERHGAPTRGWSEFKLWYEENLQLPDSVESLGLPLIRVGYEQLATAPQAALEQLCAGLGLEFDERMLVPAASNGHLVGGNTMRLSPSKTQAVVYSSRWLARTEWLVPSLVCRRIMRANSQWVYGGVQIPVDQYRRRITHR